MNKNASPLGSTQDDLHFKTKVVVSFLIIYFVWGSTYLANTWTIQDIPPFLMSGFRFFVAGMLMYAYSEVFIKEKASKAQLLHSFKAGFFLFAVGNGLIVWSLQYINSGIAALMVSLQPLMTAIFLWIMKKEKPEGKTWIGIGLGIVGMYLLIGQPDFANHANLYYGVMAILVAILGWAYITVWLVDADLPQSMVLRAALQMIFGGLILLLFGLIKGEWSQFAIENIKERAMWSMVYLIIIGSIVAFTAFNFLIKNVTPTKVVTSTYINPIVALFLGYFLNNEGLSWQSLVATLLLIGGVVLINLNKRKKHKL